jgi:hypothetical protein
MQFAYLLILFDSRIRRRILLTEQAPCNEDFFDWEYLTSVEWDAKASDRTIGDKMYDKFESYVSTVDKVTLSETIQIK